MRYNWNKDLKDGQNLRTFGSALSYFKECMDELILIANTQLTTIENLIDSAADHRIYIGASDRTQYAFSILQYYLRRYCGYDGENRPDIFIIGRDANVPTNDPKIDLGIVVSGSSFSPPAVHAMKVLADEKVKTFFLTYTTQEKAMEEQEKVLEEKEEIKESVWDNFIKQSNFEERIIYLPMREESQKKEQKRASLAPLGTKFELSASAIALGLGNGLRTYHSCNRDFKSTETPIVTFLDTLVAFRNYLDKDLQEQCYASRAVIADLITDLYGTKHIKIVGYGGSEFNVLSFTNRLTHCGHLGKGEKDKENKSVQILKSAYPRFISKNNMVIGVTKSGDNAPTSYIMNEAMKQHPEKTYLITCNSKPTITAYTQKIVLPPVISTIDEIRNPNSELGRLNIYTFLDSCIAQLAEMLHFDEEDMQNLHSRFG